MSVNKKEFKYNGYTIPSDLVMLTGGGMDDWEDISKYHLEMYRKYTPINSDDTILEIGCGVGRDAIELTTILSKKGKYIGTDIIKPSIQWCKTNITKKYPNFKFIYHDIQSQIHNSGGTIKTTDIKLPIKDSTVDRIFLHSVFTHMFEADIIHYLKEFNRVLKSDGVVLTSFFVIDEKARKSLEKHKNKVGRHPLSFEHNLNESCYINDKEYPEGAVGYTPKKIKQMLRKANLVILGNHTHRGAWSGLAGSNGQDVLLLRKSTKAEAIFQEHQKMQYTER